MSEATPPTAAMPRCRLVWLAIGLAFALAVTKVTSFDAWVHLSLGRWMVEHLEFPRTNLLSHTMPDRPTLDHQWLFQLGLYGIWWLVGVGGAILAKAAVVAAAFGVVVATARRKGAHPLAACLLAVVAALAARFRFTLRPQVVAFLLFSLYILLLERWRDDQRRGVLSFRPLLLILPLQVLWANVHGSAIIGAALVLGYAAAQTLRSFLRQPLRRSGPPRRHDDLLLWATGILVVQLSLASPNHFRLLALPFTHASAQSTSGLKELLLDRASIQWADLTGRHLFFTILAGVGLPAVIASLVRRDVTEAGLFLGLLGMAVMSERFIGLFAIAAAPIVARNVTLLFRHSPQATRPSLAATAATAVLLIGLTAFWIYWRRHDMPPGLGTDWRQLPAAEIQTLHAEYPDGNLFNEFEDGGTIAWLTRRPVFIDSRGMLAYEPSFFQSYVRTWDPRVPIEQSREALARLIEDRGITVALVRRTRLRRLFPTLPGWRSVFATERAEVFARVAPPATERSSP